MATPQKVTAPDKMTFVGIIMVLIGIFFIARTAVNYFIFPKYPIVPVTSLASFTGSSIGVYDETSCQDDMCVKSFSDARKQAMITDISNSIFFLFLGSGVIYIKKRFYK